MSKRIIILSISLLLVQVCYAQIYKKAKFTDILFYRLSKKEVNQIPKFVDRDEVRNIILNGIEEIIKEKYNITDFEYSEGKKITFMDGFSFKGLKTRKKAKSEKEKGTLYIGIQSSIMMPQFEFEQNLHRFATTIKLFNDKGKKVHSYTFTQVFLPGCEEKIVGPDVLTNISFTELFLGGFKNALENKANDDLNIQYIKLELADSYSGLYENSKKYYIRQSQKDYQFEDEEKKLQKMAAYKVPEWFGFTEDNTRYIDNAVEVNKLKEFYKLENTIQNKTYKVKLIQKEKMAFQVITLDSEIKVKFNHEGKKVGLLNFDINNKLAGELNGRKYTVLWKPEYYCSEIYRDDILLGVINELSKDRVFFVSNSVTEEEKAELVNILFAYDFAVGLRILSYKIEGDKDRHNMENGN